MSLCKKERKEKKMEVEFFWGTCVPNGFVNTITSPGSAWSGVMNSPRRHKLSATPPMIGHGLSTVCPPVTLVPASCARSWVQL